MSKSRVVGTGAFGRTTVERYQLTQIGAGRLQSGNFPRGIHPVTVKVLRALAELGGIADDDELRMQTQTNPSTLRVILRRLIDMGLVMPVRPTGLVPPTLPRR